MNKHNESAEEFFKWRRCDKELPRPLWKFENDEGYNEDSDTVYPFVNVLIVDATTGKMFIEVAMYIPEEDAWYDKLDKYQLNDEESGYFVVM